MRQSMDWARLCGTCLLILSLYGCGRESARDSDLRGTTNEDDIALMVQEKFKAAPVLSMISNVVGQWNCVIYSTLQGDFRVTRHPGRYVFSQEGHFVKNTANPKFPVWRLSNQMFFNDSIEDIPLPTTRIDPAVTRVGRLASNLLIIEATTSDARTTQFALPAVSEPTLRVFAYEVCRR